MADVSDQTTIESIAGQLASKVADKVGTVLEDLRDQSDEDGMITATAAQEAVHTAVGAVLSTLDSDYRVTAFFQPAEGDAPILSEPLLNLADAYFEAVNR